LTSILLAFLRFSSNYYYFILTYLILLRLNFLRYNSLLKASNYFYLEENFFILDYFNNIKIYSSSERFTKSHILNNNLKKKSFFFFQGFINSSIFALPFYFNLTTTCLKLIEILKIDYLFLNQKNKLNINYFLTYKYAYLRNFNSFSFKNFFLSIFHFNTNKKNLICKDYLPSFYFILFNEKKFNLLKKQNEAYTLSMKLNYLFIFNKYFRLEALSAVLTNYLFFKPTPYNLKFFFFKLSNFFFLKILNTTFLLRRFEVFFF
jgi:hypothetical protein